MLIVQIYIYILWFFFRTDSFLLSASNIVVVVYIPHFTSGGIPLCLVKMQKAQRTLFPTCWHIHVLGAFLSCAGWHCCYHFVHKNIQRVWWHYNDPAQADVSGSFCFVLLEAAGFSGEHRVSPGRAPRRVSGGCAEKELQISQNKETQLLKVERDGKWRTKQNWRLRNTTTALQSRHVSSSRKPTQ